MFETPKPQKSNLLWKIIPVAVVIFAGIIAFFVYFSRTPVDPSVELAGVLRSGDGTYQWYEQYVELKSPRIQMATNFAGKPIVIFSGVIANNGERAMDAVEIKAVFFNSDQPVWETVRSPIRPERGAYTPPIRPFEERAFTFYIENLPKGWRASNAEMSIHGFRFVEQPRS